MFVIPTSRFSNFLRSVDKFSVPFQFAIESSHKKRKTEIGGILTILVYSLSISYLIYLLNLYLVEGIDPKISVNTITSNEQNFYTFDEETIAFGFFAKYPDKSSKSLIDLEKETVQHQQFDESGTHSVKQMQIKECQNSNLKGFFCMDFSQLKNQKINLKYNSSSSSLILEGFSIFVQKCLNPLEQQQQKDQEKPQQQEQQQQQQQSQPQPQPQQQDLLQENCADSNEIDDILFNFNNEMKVAVKILRFNTSDQTYESQYLYDGYILDNNLAESRKYSLIQSKSTLSNGVLFQNKKEVFSLDNFQKSSEVHFDSIKLPRIGLSKSLITFRLSQEIRYISIQYPQITEILAQSLSLFGFLLILGQIGYKLSELILYQGIANIFIQEYYKRTAIQLLNYQSQMKDKKKQEKPVPQEQKVSFFSESLKKQMASTQQEIHLRSGEKSTPSSPLKESEQIFKDFREINKTHFPNILSKVFSLNFFKKIYLILRRKIPQSSQKQNPSLFNSTNQLISDTRYFNNIYDFFREFIKLKMMVGLLLTKEQYAAIKCCGVDVQNIESLLPNQPQRDFVFNFSESSLPIFSQQREDTKILSTEKPEQQNLKGLQQLFNKATQSQPMTQLTIQLKEKDTSDEKLQNNIKQTNQRKSINLNSERATVLQIQDTHVAIEENNQNFQQENEINHLEILEGIDKNETFLQDANQKQQEQSELNKRIYSCIAKNDQIIIKQ